MVVVVGVVGVVIYGVFVVLFLLFLVCGWLGLDRLPRRRAGDERGAHREKFLHGQEDARG